MKLYFIQEHLDRTIYHGGIGNVDAEKIFLKKGFTPIRFPYHYEFSFKAKVARCWYLLSILFKLPKQSCVIFQFPLYAGMNKLLIWALQCRKSIRIICFITDIDGIKDGNDKLLKKEIAVLSGYSYFIIHNEAMKQWLISKTGQRNVSCINFFDFLTPAIETVRPLSFEIAFAGNLAKSVFLNEMEKLQTAAPKIVFNVYGKDPSYAILQQANVCYMGFSEPYLLPSKLTGAFGLVWDGDAVGEPAGSLGIYMKYISHHKLSLYLLSGMPVIVWKSGAAAALVKEYNIGFAVTSLYELGNALTGITEEAYREMAANASLIAASISKGERLGGAIDELLNKMHVQ